MCVVVVAGLAPAAPLAAQLGPGVERELESVVESAMDAVPVPGLAVAVLVDGEVAFQRGFGVMDLQSRSPVTPTTLFQIGSISKAFTATLAAQMVEEGLISWDDPLDRHLRHVSLPSPVPTLGHLAEHTSGLPGDAPTLRRRHGDYPVLAFTHFELYQSLARSELQSAPGESWAYSNFGYGVLGHALEVAADSPWEVLVEDELLDPLGLGSTTATLWPELRDRLATPHWIVDGELVEYLAPWDEEALAPAGGLSSSLEDLSRFVLWQLEQSGGEGEVAGLQEPRSDLGALSYGRGWFVETLPGVGRAVSVGGDVDGYVGELVLVPERGLGTIVLANSGDAPFLPQLGRWILGSLVAAQTDDPTADAALEAAYRKGMIHQAVGEWELALGELERAAGARDRRTRGNALYQIGRTSAFSGVAPDRAVAALREYLDAPLSGNPPAAALWRLGQVHEHAGRCDAALAAYREALADDAGYGPARSALARLEERGGACDGRAAPSSGSGDARGGDGLWRMTHDMWHPSDLDGRVG